MVKKVVKWGKDWPDIPIPYPYKVCNFEELTFFVRCDREHLGVYKCDDCVFRSPETLIDYLSKKKSLFDAQDRVNSEVFKTAVGALKRR